MKTMRWMSFDSSKSRFFFGGGEAGQELRRGADLEDTQGERRSGTLDSTLQTDLTHNGCHVDTSASRPAS